MKRLPVEHHHDLTGLAEKYWWHVHRVRLVTRLARRFLKNPSSRALRYVDIGGGAGATTSRIAENLAAGGYLSLDPDHVTCFEGDPEIQAHPTASFIRYLRQDIEDPGFPSDRSVSYTFFTLLDVLEHLEAPARFLRTLQAVLTPGAVGVITVPAFPFLFSDWDTCLNHKRRYTRAQLEKEVRDAGYTPLWSSYLFSYAFPFAWVSRRFLKRSATDGHFPRVPSGMNWGLRICGRMEETLTAAMRLPFGTSVIAVVQAPGSGGKKTST